MKTYDYLVDARFAERMNSGDCVEKAAVAAWLNPRRIPIRLASIAPEILRGGSVEFYKKMEKEGRVPPGTAELARSLKAAS